MIVFVSKRIKNKKVTKLCSEWEYGLNRFLTYFTVSNGKSFENRKYL